jgi:5-methylcytosine-specific restriction endonuclease McrA
MTDVLVLNATYEYLNVTPLQRAVRLLFAGKAEIVERHRDVITAPSVTFPLPSVIRMLYYIRRPQAVVALTKRNVLLRDDFHCQYCGAKDKSSDLTVDHVQPKSRGGPSTWENLVCACQRCNGRKRNRTPEEAGMPLLRKPKRPRHIPWVSISRNTLPNEWGKFLFFSVSIEVRTGD